MDKQMRACLSIREQFPERILEIGDLVAKVDSLQLVEPAAITFHRFLNNLVIEKHGRQRNNHNLLKTFLAEKVDSHVRVQYNLINGENAHTKIYAKNVAPKKILSNHFLSNEIESIFEVPTLENTFVKFSRSNRCYLSVHDETLDFGNISLIRNNAAIDENEIPNIKRYFALQFTRREFYLYDILALCLKILKTNVSSMDLLDYFICKYIYNSSLSENFKNWNDHLMSYDHIYQVQYKSCKHNITYLEVAKTSPKFGPSDYISSDLAITEVHTLIVAELLSRIKTKAINTALVECGFSKFTKAELEQTKYIVVTVGSDNKLCYLLNKTPNNTLFDKINFVVHQFWDQAMLQGVLVNLLLSKKSKYDAACFKASSFSKSLINRAIFMHDIFEKSREFESLIKPETL